MEQIAAGQLHSMAITSDGSVWTWGYNLRGQLGDRTNSNRSLPSAISAAGLSWSLPAPTFNTQSGLFYNSFNVVVTSPYVNDTLTIESGVDVRITIRVKQLHVELLIHPRVVGHRSFFGSKPDV